MAKPKTSFVSSRIPLYYQLENVLREKITSGAFVGGGRIPTEIELIKQYNVSRITVRQALRSLAEDGLIERLLVALLALPVSTALSQAPSPTFTAQDILDITTFQVADLSADGRWAVATTALRRDGFGNDFRRDGDPTYLRPGSVRGRHAAHRRGGRPGQRDPVHAVHRNGQGGGVRA